MRSLRSYEVPVRCMHFKTSQERSSPAHSSPRFRGAHLMMSSTRRIISAASVADSITCAFTCTQETEAFELPCFHLSPPSSL